MAAGRLQLVQNTVSSAVECVIGRLDQSKRWTNPKDGQESIGVIKLN